MMPCSRFEGVRVTAVDNFYGEENDIVLLSLVRSNDGQIGFLKTENRICVALSRARKGLHVIGNFTLMAQQSSLWTKIIKDLKDINRIRTVLHLTCQNHPGKVTHVENANDFKKVQREDATGCAITSYPVGMYVKKHAILLILYKAVL